jgi:hypothetical protein
MAGPATRLAGEEAHRSEEGDEKWEDFGQRVDLTARIREILINYPEGTSILKELLQVLPLPPLPPSDRAWNCLCTITGRGCPDMPDEFDSEVTRL